MAWHIKLALQLLQFRSKSKWWHCIFVFFCINLRLSIAMWAIGQVLPTPFNRPANRPANSSLRLFLVNNRVVNSKTTSNLSVRNSSFYQSGIHHFTKVKWEVKKYYFTCKFVRFWHVRCFWIGKWVLNSPSRFKFAVCTEIRRNVNVLSIDLSLGFFALSSRWRVGKTLTLNRALLSAVHEQKC